MPKPFDGIVGPGYLGIDPGASGGAALVGGFGDETATISFGNSTDTQMWGWLASHLPGTFAVIEKNSGYVGGAGNPGSAMFKFGVSTGKLLGYLVAAGIPFVEVTPGTWQKKMGISPRKRAESKTQFKNRLKQAAERLFPGARLTLATCDAVLIAEYCRRWREGRL